MAQRMEPTQTKSNIETNSTSGTKTTRAYNEVIAGLVRMLRRHDARASVKTQTHPMHPTSALVKRALQARKGQGLEVLAKALHLRQSSVT